MKKYKVNTDLMLITNEGKKLTILADSVFKSEDTILLDGVEEIHSDTVFYSYNPWWFEKYGILDIWKMGFTGKGVKVAVLDSGIFLKGGYPHIDLSNINNENLFDVTNDNVRMYDHRGHGIHISGIIKASNNGMGVTGIAFNSDFYFAKITNSVYGDNLKYLIDGINWAISKQVHIINISSGWTGLNNDQIEQLHKAVKNGLEKNILIVSAAGNKFSNSGDDFYPAPFEETLSVGAVDKNNSPIPSSVNNNKIDIYAPGDNIYSTSNGKNNEYYKYETGSSQACAYVTGVAALLIEALFSKNE